MNVVPLRPPKKAQGVIDDGRPVSVVDIGSNSVRLVIYENKQRDPGLLFNEKVLCGLGAAVSTTGAMDDVAVQRALDALRRFRAIGERLDALPLNTLATAAAREAENGPAFLKQAQKITGSKIRVLTGEEEAYYAARGLAAGLQSPHGIGGDLGGGSLELVSLLEKDQVKNRLRWVTLPLGGLRLSADSFGDVNTARAIVRAQLDQVKWLGRAKDKTFYCVGGTWRAIARVHMAEQNYPMEVLHQYRITSDQAREICQRIASLPTETPLLGHEKISNSRREILPFGAIVLDELLEHLQVQHVKFSQFGIREGFLFDLLPERERKRDPLLTGCDTLSVLRSRSPKHARELCDWTDTLLGKRRSKTMRQIRRLGHAACLISDISWRMQPNYRSEQAMAIATNASFAWLTHMERAFIAMTLFYRHEGMRKSGHDDLKSMLSPEFLHWSQVYGAAIRSAHLLSLGMPGVLPNAPLQLTKTKLEWTIPGASADFDGERLRRRYAWLGRVLGRRTLLTINDKSHTLYKP